MGTTPDSHQIGGYGASFVHRVRETSGAGEKRKSLSPLRSSSDPQAQRPIDTPKRSASLGPIRSQLRSPSPPRSPFKRKSANVIIDSALDLGAEADAEGDLEVPPVVRSPSNSTQSKSKSPLVDSSEDTQGVNVLQTEGQSEVLPYPAAAQEWPQLPAADLLPPHRPGDDFVLDPTLVAAGAVPCGAWKLQTTNLPVGSQPPSSSDDSPSTPLDPGKDNIYALNTDIGSYDVSRQSSTTDLSYLGAIKGNSTRASSESGLEGRQDDDGSGVPPPRAKKSHARKQPAGHVKRARNAFILFRKHITDSNLIPTTVEVKHQNISVVRQSDGTQAAKMWREAPQEVRQQFQEQARAEKEEHQRMYPGYRYQPVFRRTDIIRRRVRKDQAEDDKVEAVAEALIKGKAGNALESEIKEQMAQRSEASESEAEASSSKGTRRRRRETGQLSKGAIRAQRAAVRAKQMRQNLLGSNLLSMSMYNAQMQNQQAQVRAAAMAGPGGHVPTHPGQQHHMQYAMPNPYLSVPMEYDLDGRPIMAPAPGASHMPQGMCDFDDGMYHLPPIEGVMYDPGSYDADGGGAAYYDPNIHGPHGHHYDHPGPPGGFYPPPGHMNAGLQSQNHEYGNAEYRLPPLMENRESNVGMPPHEDGHGPEHGYGHRPGGARDEDGIDPRMRDWSGDGGQQTPSGHVLFNERLFDGAFGSAMLPPLGVGGGPGEEERDREEGLAGYEEAIKQVDEVRW